MLKVIDMINNSVVILQFEKEVTKYVSWNTVQMIWIFCHFSHYDAYFIVIIYTLDLFAIQNVCTQVFFSVV